VRVPFERWSIPGGSLSWRGTAGRQVLLNFAMWPWASRDHRTSAALGLKTPHFVGRIHTGVLSAAVLAATFRSLQPGVTELMVHPGYVDAALSQTNTRLLASRAQEVELLCAPDTQDLIIDERVDLVRHDLAFSTKRSLRHAS
jgi:predicted glycoside hydrolase/deacetylase ChbG (UPF0249 family)